MAAPMDRLMKRPANHPPLSPVNFLKRAATAYSDRTSVIYGRTRFTWKQTDERCLRLGSALRSLLGVSKNDVVSVLAPNIPAVVEMHFGVSYAGAVLNTINTRLDAGGVASILVHSEAKVPFVDYQYVKLAADALGRLPASGSPSPAVVLIDDVDKPTGARPFGELEYEMLLAGGDPACPPLPLGDEWDAIALNYMSGTTAAPKGVVYSHRGSYLSTLSALLQWEIGQGPVYLWSLPMFHCNGWTFPWGVAARGGTNVCIRQPTARDMYGAIAEYGVTHLCAAPTVLIILLEGGAAHKRGEFPSPVKILTGGAPPPPPSVIEKMERMGFSITHSYGLTEATGSGLVCEWRQEWDLLPPEERARLKVRQGVGALSLADVDVKDAATMASVPHDGETVGEIMLRGGNVMKGYYKNAKDTEAAFKGDWFLTGDLGVVHPDGYVEIKDRAKDVIISGGENISSVELEAVLYRHPMVVEAAAVAMPHPRWGETPCAFVKVKEGGGAAVKEEEIIAHCRSRMSGFMVPKKVMFMEELPKTSTGKIRKFLLRDMARALYEKASEAPPPANVGYGKGGDHVLAATRYVMARL